MTKLFKLTLAAGAAVLAVGAHAQSFPAAGKTITRDASVVNDKDAGTRTREATTTLPDARTTLPNDSPLPAMLSGLAVVALCPQRSTNKRPVPAHALALSPQSLPVAQIALSTSTATPP